MYHGRSSQRSNHLVMELKYIKSTGRVRERFEEGLEFVVGDGW